MHRRMEKPDNKEAAQRVKEMLDNGYFDYDEVNLWGRGSIQRKEGSKPISAADAKEIRESIAKIPLREFLASSGTTGIAGAVYLVPTKIHQIMFDSAVQADICADISIAVIPPDQIPGTKQTVDIAVDGSYVPKKYRSGGQLPTETIATVEATLDFTEGFGINFRITNDLIEDSQFDVIEMHLRDAGREIGEFASNEALTILGTAPDGDGAINGCTSTVANTTKIYDVTAANDDITDAIHANATDGFVSDTWVVPHHCMLNEALQTGGVGAGNDSPLWGNFTTDGFPLKACGLNVVYNDGLYLTVNGTFVAAKSVVFAKEYALLTGRKRWLRMEKYSDPVRDLVGATVTSRQDSVSIYKDAICLYQEV